MRTLVLNSLTILFIVLVNLLITVLVMGIGAPLCYVISWIVSLVLPEDLVHIFLMFFVVWSCIVLILSIKHEKKFIGELVEVKIELDLPFYSAFRHYVTLKKHQRKTADPDLGVCAWHILVKQQRDQLAAEKRH